MTTEKKSFDWDTVMTLSLTSDKMTVQGTDIEVVWCPVTEMFWEVQTMTTLCATGKSSLDDVTPMYRHLFCTYLRNIAEKT